MRLRFKQTVLNQRGNHRKVGGFLLFLSLLLAWIIVDIPVSAQILPNGGFESGLSGWNISLTTGGVASFQNSTIDVHSGTNALQVMVSNAGTASNSVRLTTATFAAGRSDTYVLRFWASSSVLRANLGISINGATPAFPEIPFQISTNENSYQEYLYTFRAVGAISISFDFQTVGEYWLDDVEILDLNNTEGWDIPMTYLWRWGQLNASKTNSVGWTGGDNGKSVLLPNGDVAWIFNDTLAANLNFYSNVRGPCSLPRNSVVRQSGTNLYWLNNGKNTFFVPVNTNNLFWIGDGVVESNQVLVLLTEVDATAITRVGTAIATMSLPDLKLESIAEVPSPGTDNYGAFVNAGDGYYYIYNGPEVARVPIGGLAISSDWNYWDGSGWVTNHLLSVGLSNLDNPWSVVKLGESNFAAVYMPALSLTIAAQYAPSPMGPWSRPVPLCTVLGEWGEINYAANVCAGTGTNGIYTIGYSDDGSPEGLGKWGSDLSFYNPHFVKANLYQLSPLSLASGTGGAGSSISIKFAADKDYGNDAINNLFEAGVLNTTNWFNLYGPDGGSMGMAAVPYYSFGGAKYASRAKLVYDWADEFNSDNNDRPLTNNVALLDGYIVANNNGWYLSVTNLDGIFTNGYTVYFYYRGGGMGQGGQNYLRFYRGLTTNSMVGGIRRWNLYTTSTTNNGTFVQDVSSSNVGTAGETFGANYFVISNLYGGAFDLLMTNGNSGGISALEIVANPAITTSVLTPSSYNPSFGQSLQATDTLAPAPPDGETVFFLDGTNVVGSADLLDGMASVNLADLGTGTHLLSGVYPGDGIFLASTSSVSTILVSPSIGNPLLFPAGPIYAGMDVSLYCSNFAGSQPFHFQWQARASGTGLTNVAGGMTNLLTMTRVTTNDSGYYQLVFTANGESVTSAPILLTVNALPALQMRVSGGLTVLNWSAGTLLQSTNLTGNWVTNDVPPPYTDHISAPQMFFRVKVR